MEEEWRFIENSEYYQVSNLGRVRRLGGVKIRGDGKPYTFHPMILKPNKLKNGYLVRDFKLDINKHILIHRAVLTAFKPIENMVDMQVNHIDGDKCNNNLSNLEWVDRRENMQHAMAAGLFNPQERYGEKHPMCKLSIEQVEEIRLALKNGKRGIQHQLAEKYGVSDTTICEIKIGRTRRKG